MLTTEVGRLSSAIDQRGVDLSHEIESDFEVISDAGSDNCCYDGNNITLLLKNTGSRGLPKDTNQIDVLVDATYDSDVNITVLEETEWEPESVARLNVTESGLDSGDHRVKISIKGDEEVFQFRV